MLKDRKYVHAVRMWVGLYGGIPRLRQLSDSVVTVDLLRGTATEEEAELRRGTRPSCWIAPGPQEQVLGLPGQDHPCGHEPRVRGRDL